MTGSKDYAHVGHHSILPSIQVQWKAPASLPSMYNPDPQLYTAAQMRALEARVMQSTEQGGMGVSGYTLMQRAGQCAFEVLLHRWPSAKGITVVCGKGNNAGDGYVVARMALQFGLRVQLLAAANPSELAGDAKLAHQAFVAAGGKIEAADQPIMYEVIVDGLLGTGFKLPLREHYLSIIRRINESAALVLALDIPSGVEADTGAVTVLDGEMLAVQAKLTVSFIGRKIGLHTGAGVAFVGEQQLEDLGVSSEYLQDSTGVRLLSWQPQQLPPLPLTAYKHRRGRVVIVGGDHGMGGAVIMAAEAAMRCGVGLVTVVAQPEHQPALLARMPEVMFLHPESEDLSSVFAAADFIVVGPGLGRKDWGRDLFARVAASTTSLLIDADGLYWLKALKGKPATESLFITPHGGEAASLLETQVAVLEKSRIAAATSLARTHGCSAVLKGPGSVVFTNTSVHICAHGGPAMATAGMGDVLSGVCAGLLAPVFAADAAQEAENQFAQAVALHSACADLAAQELGPRSVIATDVIKRIPTLLAAQGG